MLQQGATNELREQLGRQDTEQRPYPYQTAEVAQFVGCGSGNFQLPFKISARGPRTRNIPVWLTPKSATSAFRVGVGVTMATELERHLWGPVVAGGQQCLLWVKSRHRVTSVIPTKADIHHRVARPPCAMCGRLRVGKGFLHVCSIGRCSHVFGRPL
jgi:hypothetical protein